jgi:hypothetical protein
MKGKSMTHPMEKPTSQDLEYSTPEHIPPGQRPEGVAWLLLLQAVEAGEATIYKKSNGSYVVHCVDGDLFPVHEFIG